VALIADLVAFFEEHRRCGALDAGAAAGRVWLTCECGAGLSRPLAPPAALPARE